MPNYDFIPYIDFQDTYEKGKIRLSLSTKEQRLEQRIKDLEKRIEQLEQDKESEFIITPILIRHGKSQKEYDNNKRITEKLLRTIDNSIWEFIKKEKK